MPFDIEDITGADPGKGQKKTSPGFDPSDIKAAAQSGTGATSQSLITGSIDPNTSFEDFRFQPKTNADNYLLRAQDQGFWESLGKTVGNVATNIPLDIAQGVGYLGSMFEMGDDRDYSNALTREIEKLKSPFGEVYREHPDKVFDMTDSAWWMNNLGQLVESAASFALEGAGIAKLMGNLAKAAAWSTRSAKLGAKAAQGISAGALTYMEGAMSGAQVFETAYNNNYMKQIQQGVDPTEADQNAKQIASQAAAATVQIHTAMNIGLNLTGIAPIFREPDQAIVSWWRRNGRPLAGETQEQWAARIAAAVPEGMPLRKLLGLGMQGPARLGLETLQEGLEEVNTQYAEHIGKAIGEGKENKDVVASLMDTDRYFKEVLNEEGALNMALGALGGMAQTVIMDNVPIHKVIKYGPDGKPLLTEQGTPQTERISSNTMNERMNRQYFDNIRDALSKDMTWFAEKNREMEEALKNKDLATLASVRADLLSVHNLRAISMGLGDVWKQQYQDIINLDNTRSLADDLQPQIDELDKQIEADRGAGDMEAANQKSIQRYQLQQQQNALQDVTEAVQKGYAQDKSDNSYQQKAQQAIQNLDYLTDLYNNLQDKYSGTPEMEQSGLADHMFYRQANQYLHKQQLDTMQEDLIKLKAKVDALTLNSEDDLLVNQAKSFLADKEILDNTIKKLNQDIARLNEAVKSNNTAVYSKMLEKYKIPATPQAGKQLVAAIERRKAELQKRIEYTNKELSDTIQVWQVANPGGKVADVLNKASQKPLLEDMYNQNKQYYQQALTQHQIAQEQLAKDSSEAGIRKYIKENKPQDRKKQQEQEHIQAYNQQLDREIAANMDAKQKQQQLARVDQDLAQKRFEKGAINESIRKLRDQVRNKPGFKNIAARRKLQAEIKQLQEKLADVTLEEQTMLIRRAALTGTATQASQAAQNISRSPAPTIQPATSVAAESTPAENTEQSQQQFSEELPDFDFSQEVAPTFTTVENGHAVFDRIMGGQEAGNTFRQFVNLRRSSDINIILNAMRTMLQKTNQQMPSEEDFNKFVVPYLTALKEQYLNQVKDPAEQYEELKGFLKPEVLTILDILEGEFREHGFSYDRAIQVLNQQVAAGNLQKNMVGPVVNQLKAYLEFVQQPTSTQPEHVDPVQPAAPTTSTELADVETRKQALIQLMQATGEPVFEQGVTDGTFAGIGRLNMDTNGNVILTRNAATEEELTKGGVIANKDELRAIAQGSGQFGGAQVATSASDIGSNAAYGGVVGKYAIPLQEMIKLMKEGYIQFAGLGNAEFILSPHIAERYLATIDGRPVNSPAEKEFNEEPGTYIPAVPDSEPTVFSNAALDTEVIQQDLKRFVGFSNIEIVKANFNTHPYREFDNGKEIRIVSDYTQLESGLNLDVLVPGMVTPGDDVVFEVDENWTGEVNYDTEMMQDDFGEQLRRADSFQNYLEAPGRIGMVSTAAHPRGAHANVPIKIIQKSTGKTLGYLPRADWVTAKYPDTQNYRNVTDTYQDGDTEVTDNVARQYSRIIKLRENIIRAWNINPNLKMTSKVSKRGTGHVMLNREVNPNTGRTKLVNRSAKNMLPDPSLEIAIMKQGSAYVGTGTITGKQVSSRLPQYMQEATSLPVVMLPSPDGTFVPAPLYTHRLGDNPSQLNTVVGAIALYLRAVAGQQRAGDQKAIEKIREASGFDIRLSSGLRDFVQQYFTYTQKFGEKDTVITPSEVSSARPEFMLDIPDEMPGEKAAFIKVGTSFSGERPMYAQLVNGELHPDFEQALREGLQNRFKNVVFAGKQLRGVNSMGEFSAPIIKKDGSVQVNKYANYNEYVKANSTTYVYGLNKVGSQYVYMANPVVQVDYDQALRTAPPVVSTNIQDQQQEETTDTSDQIFEEPDELADLFGNGILSPSPGSVQSLQVPSEGEQVTLEFLQDLRNITPEAHRNSKTPEQVLRELLERGVTVLADGHNPFYTC